MAEAAAKPDAAAGDQARWMLVRVGVGRVSRWFVCSVLLAAVPILVSFLALPKSSSVTALLSHGDFAVLASALAAASIGELIGPAEPPPGLRNVLVLASLVLFTSTVILLMGIAGNFARLSPPLDATLSLIAFAIATVIGIASWAATVEPPSEVQRDRAPGGREHHPASEDEVAGRQEQA
jgi:hypothetical protein